MTSEWDSRTMSDKPATLTDHYTVRSYEVGPDDRVTPAALANYLQETAGHHAEALEVGPPQLLPHGIFWVLSRLRIVIHQLPRPQSQLELLTWPSELDRAAAYRDFIMSNGAGKVCEATTGWLMFDLEQRKMVQVPQWVVENIPEAPPRNLNFERRALPKLRDATHETMIHSRRADLDMLGHVNNVHFLEWALESPPQVWLDEKRLVEIDIQFRNECKAGEEIASRSADVEGEPGALLHSLVRISDNVEIARAFTRWADKE